MATNKSSEAFKVIVTRANKIRSEKKCSQKEAFALAKAEIAAETAKQTAQSHIDQKIAKLTVDSFREMLAKQTVEIVFTNRRGKEETTRATLNEDYFRKGKTPIGGAKTPKRGNIETSVTFYDRIHGMMRTVSVDSIKEYKTMTK